MALKTWVARFVVDHGRVTEEGGRLRSFQRRRLDEQDVDLHILCEPEGSKGDELGAQALDAIGRLFLQDRLSLTGGLMRSLRNTHQTLQDWNRRSLPKEQVSVGIAAAVVCENLVYLAQAGPGVCFLIQDGELQRLAVEDEAVVALGGEELEPALRRFELKPGDMLVAASPTLEQVIDRQTLEGLLARSSEEVLPDLYLMTRDLPNFALFAITCSEVEEERPLVESEEAVSFGLPAASDLEEDDQDQELPRRPAFSTAAIDVPTASGSTASVKEGAMPELRFEEKPEEAPSTVVSKVALMTPKPLDISKPVVKLRSDQSVGRSDYARTTTGSARGPKLNLNDGKILRFGGGALLLVLVIAFVPGLVKQGRNDKLGDLIVASQKQLAASASSGDPGEKRRLLDDARRLATEALRLDSGNTQAAQLRDQATDATRKIDAVYDLGSLTPLSTFSRQVTGDISLESLTVAGDTAYILDTKGGRILTVPVAGGAPQTAYQDGETYGGTPAKKPIYFTWEGNDQGGRLLILDAERKLFEIRPGGQPSPLQLRRTNTWASVAGIAAYDGNLYVLDPRGNQVHRYLPAATGFDSEPTAVLSGIKDLGTAQGIAVDGDIFVFLKDGQVRRFRSGAEMDFPLSGVDRTPKAATDIAIVPSAEEVFLADSGNKRVLVASKDGNYRRQYVSNSFTDIRAIAVSASGAQMYVVAGDTLFATPVARPN